MKQYLVEIVVCINANSEEEAFEMANSWLPPNSEIDVVEVAEPEEVEPIIT